MPRAPRISCEYDKAIRLTALVNENNVAYEFAYDASDRLIEEKRIYNLTRRFTYNVGGHLTRSDEIGYGERAERPQRSTEFEREVSGRLLAKVYEDARQDYVYDARTACSAFIGCLQAFAKSWAWRKRPSTSAMTC